MPGVDGFTMQVDPLYKVSQMASLARLDCWKRLIMIIIIHSSYIVLYLLLMAVSKHSVFFLQGMCMELCVEVWLQFLVYQVQSLNMLPTKPGHWANPFSFWLVHWVLSTTHGTNSFTSFPNWTNNKCLAYGHRWAQVSQLGLEPHSAEQNQQSLSSVCLTAQT